MKSAIPKSPTNDALEMSISEDEIISGLMEARGKRVEVIAFGIAYTGTLTTVNIENGFATVLDGDDCATLEFERIEAVRVLI